MQPLNYEELTMQSDTFEPIRRDFDLLLQKLFKKMEVNQSDEGSIDLKINIEMSQDFVPQEDGTSKLVNKPILKHKISTVVPVKDSTDGTKDTGMELVYDEGLKRYVLKYVSVGGQMSIFDVQEAQEKDSNIIDAVPAIEQKSGYFLPDNSADEEIVDDGEENAESGDTEDEDEPQEPLPFEGDGTEDGDEGFSDGYDYDEPMEG